MQSWLVVLVSTLALADNAELKQICDADQNDRVSAAGKQIDWEAVGPRDGARRKRVREMLDANLVITGQDFERAALVFQHGDAPDDFLNAHVLAVTALGKGAMSARWLAAATLDRYLQKVAQPQVFGTQYSYKMENGKPLPWTMEPYSRTLVSPAVRSANCVPDFEDQAAMLETIIKGTEPRPPKRPPC